MAIQAHKRQILFIVQYPEHVSPSQRFRFELYKNLLRQNGFEITTQTFIDKKGYEIIFAKGYFFRKAFAVARGFLRRVKLLFTISKYDFVLLHCGVAPVGPPVFEWFFIKLLKAKIIYDFDDAVWIRRVSESNKLMRFLKAPQKVAVISKWAYKVSCGNVFLCNYARQYNTSVTYNPTCVDTERNHNILANHDVEKVSIGWTGSFSTLQYLTMAVPVLKRLQANYNVGVTIICNQAPEIDLQNVNYVPWTEEDEVKELAKCQIGIMPLPHDEWAEGKCGFKLIQYLSLGIPAAASPVGVNKKIIDDGVNGFLCSTEEEWYAAIEKLILDAELRKRMGIEGRKKITNEYSLHSNAGNFLSLFT